MDQVDEPVLNGFDRLSRRPAERRLTISESTTGNGMMRAPESAGNRNQRSDRRHDRGNGRRGGNAPGGAITSGHRRRGSFAEGCPEGGFCNTLVHMLLEQTEESRSHSWLRRHRRTSDSRRSAQTQVKHTCPPGRTHSLNSRENGSHGVRRDLLDAPQTVFHCRRGLFRYDAGSVHTNSTPPLLVSTYWRPSSW